MISGDREHFLGSCHSWVIIAHASLVTGADKVRLDKANNCGLPKT
jgi:hypothetical protein